MKGWISVTAVNSPISNKSEADVVVRVASIFAVSGPPSGWLDGSMIHPLSGASVFCKEPQDELLRRIEEAEK